MWGRTVSRWRKKRGREDASARENERRARKMRAGAGRRGSATGSSSGARGAAGREEGGGLRDHDGLRHGFLLEVGGRGMPRLARQPSRLCPGVLSVQGRGLRGGWRGALRGAVRVTSGRPSPLTTQAASRSSRDRLTSTPHANPPSAPPVRSTRWQGTNSAGALRAQMAAAARTAEGRPIRSAKSA